MCRLSKDVEKNGDHYIASINTGNVQQPNPLIKEKCNQREIGKSDKIKMQEVEDDQLPGNLQHALHLSTSGSNANSTPQKAQSTSNTSASSEGSLSSASPAQSTIEHKRVRSHAAHHHFANHLHLNTSLNQHDNHDHDYHNRVANHQHLNLEHHSHHHDHDDHHQIHIHADASDLHSNGCNSTHIFSGMLLNGSGNGASDDCECATTPPFLLPKNATSWMASSSSSLEEPAFFSSSLVNGNVSTPSDLSLMSTSMSKSTSTLHTHENAHQRTLPFLNNNNMQFMDQAAAGNFHPVSDANMNMMSCDSDQFAHYANVPTFSSFLAASPSCLQSEKASEHVDFLGASDGNSAGGAECSMYQGQVLYSEDDSGTFIQYQNASQAQNWHNVVHQESHDGAYACYWASTPQGMVQVMPTASGGIGGVHTPSYVFNAMELQQPEHYVYNAHQPGRQGPTSMLPHSQSVPLGLDHFGGAHQSMHMGDQRVHITLNGGNAEGYGSSMSDFRGAVRSQLRKTKEGSSCSSIMELEDQGTHADHSWVDGHGAVQWRSGPHHMMKGMVRHSNKRPSPDGEEEESVHESAPPLKRSASWDSMGVYSNKHTNSPVSDHHMAMNMSNNMMKGSMSACKSTSPKQDKPRARQGIANDPQSIAARHRRERISERLKILQQLVPNGSKVDLVTMLEKAINYVKFLQLQVKVLATDEYWPTPLNKFPKVAAMAKLVADSKEPANLEKVEKALAETIQATS